MALWGLPLQRRPPALLICWTLFDKNSTWSATMLLHSRCRETSLNTEVSAEEGKPSAASNSSGHNASLMAVGQQVNEVQMMQQHIMELESRHSSMAQQ